jgi:hypothetical protein
MRSPFLGMAMLGNILSLRGTAAQVVDPRRQRFRRDLRAGRFTMNFDDIRQLRTGPRSSCISFFDALIGVADIHLPSLCGLPWL